MIKPNEGPPEHPPGQANEVALIRASELAQYSFCQRAWWLSVVKQIPPNNQATLKRGSQTHYNHARHVGATQHWRQAGFFLLGGGGLLLIIVILMWLLLMLKVA